MALMGARPAVGVAHCELSDIWLMRIVHNLAQLDDRRLSCSIGGGEHGHVVPVRQRIVTEIPVDVNGGRDRCLTLDE